jgi:hypothetical protein
VAQLRLTYRTSAEPDGVVLAPKSTSLKTRRFQSALPISPFLNERDMVITNSSVNILFEPF